MTKHREFLSSDEACTIYSALRVAAKQYETDAEAMRQAQQLGLAEVFAAQVARSLDLANRIEDAAEVVLESDLEVA